MPTKEAKRIAREVIERLETRTHLGPPVLDREIQEARTLLLQHEFSPSSDYFNRLAGVQSRLRTRVIAPALASVKRNYGGGVGGRWMQIQMVYDHLILSTCYDGEFHTRRGRVKISHRFNQQGRIDFVELKFLQSLHSPLDGQLRKLLLVRDFATIHKDWHSAEAFVLPALPQELVFLHAEIFRFARPQLLAWLVNIGHGIIAELETALRDRADGIEVEGWENRRAGVRWENAERGGGVAVAPATERVTAGNPRGGLAGQWPLEALCDEPGALAMVANIAARTASIEERDPKTVLVHYPRRGV